MRTAQPGSSSTIGCGGRFDNLSTEDRAVGQATSAQGFRTGIKLLCVVLSEAESTGIPLAVVLNKAGLVTQEALDEVDDEVIRVNEVSFQLSQLVNGDNFCLSRLSIAGSAGLSFYYSARQDQGLDTIAEGSRYQRSSEQVISALVACGRSCLSTLVRVVAEHSLGLVMLMIWKHRLDKVERAFALALKGSAQKYSSKELEVVTGNFASSLAFGMAVKRAPGEPQPE
ncbi:hypothetical protein SELMODRAFT_430469 [Selaginella moellendorffii]|uniref:Uncharacterized protein n=1 Tax=Selaginella moellendorffii TaxID=88036 RepID=D8T9I4_SELML|nr:hypothetical protein SELMODRAFT_430469 [Selaginella moellendorffii]